MLLPRLPLDRLEVKSMSLKNQCDYTYYINPECVHQIDEVGSLTWSWNRMSASVHYEWFEHLDIRRLSCLVMRGLAGDERFVCSIILGILWEGLLDHRDGVMHDVNDGLVPEDNDWLDYVDVIHLRHCVIQAVLDDRQEESIAVVKLLCDAMKANEEGVV